MNGILVERIFRWLAVGTAIVVLVHIFDAKMNTESWLLGQLASWGQEPHRIGALLPGDPRAGGEAQGEGMRSASAMSPDGAEAGLPGAGAGAGQVHDDGKGDGAEPGVGTEDAPAAADGARGAALWSGVLAPSDLWFLGPDRVESMARHPLKVVRKGVCSGPLQAARQTSDLAESLFPGGFLERDGRPVAGAKTRQTPATKPTPLADAGHVTEASLFFRNQDQFVQVRATWNRNVPATYRLAAVAFANAALQGTPSVPALEEFDPKQAYDVVSVRSIFESLIRKFPRQASVMQQLSRFDGQTERSMRFIGALPVTYDSAGENCQLKFAQESSLPEFECHCTML